MNLELEVGVTILVQCLRLMSIVAHKVMEAVDQPIFLGFSRIDVLMLIATHKMILLVHLLVLLGVIIGLFFALEDLLISLWRWWKVRRKSDDLYIWVFLKILIYVKELV